MQRRQFRRASCRSHGNEKRGLALGLFQRERRRPRRENVKDLTNIPSVVDTSSGRTFVEDAFNKAADEGVFPDRHSVDMRKSHGDYRPMEADGSVGKSFLVQMI